MSATIEKTNTGYSAFVEEVPGVGVAGEDYAGTIKLLRETLSLHFEADPSAIPLVVKYHDANGCTMTSVG